MAASKGQGQSLSVFLIGLTAACAGVAAFSTGVGKLALLVGIVLLAVSLWRFIQLKPLEGKIALKPQPAVAKLIGVVVVLLGWVVVLFGLHLTPSVGGRLATSILGLVISLAGVLYILPTACNKNAIWKA
jgi:hypothetical protein